MSCSKLLWTSLWGSFTQTPHLTLSHLCISKLRNAGYMRRCIPTCLHSCKWGLVLKTADEVLVMVFRGQCVAQWVKTPRLRWKGHQFESGFGWLVMPGGALTPGSMDTATGWLSSLSSSLSPTRVSVCHGQQDGVGRWKEIFPIRTTALSLLLLISIVKTNRKMLL